MSDIFGKLFNVCPNKRHLDSYLLLHLTSYNMLFWLKYMEEMHPHSKRLLGNKECFHASFRYLCTKTSSYIEKQWFPVDKLQGKSWWPLMDFFSITLKALMYFTQEMYILSMHDFVASLQIFVQVIQIFKALLNFITQFPVKHNY